MKEEIVAIKLSKEEEIKAVGLVWHNSCFYCCEPGCKIKLTLKNYKGHESKIYCEAHVPKPKATQVADDVMTAHALNVPEKGREGIHTVHKAREESRIVEDNGQFRPAPKEGAYGGEEVEEVEEVSE